MFGVWCVRLPKFYFSLAGFCLLIACDEFGVCCVD